MIALYRSYVVLLKLTVLAWDFGKEASLGCDVLDSRDFPFFFFYEPV